MILNDPSRVRRLGIKKAEEMAAKESKQRRLNAPKTIEERVLLLQRKKVRNASSSIKPSC